MLPNLSTDSLENSTFGAKNTNPHAQRFPIPSCSPLYFLLCLFIAAAAIMALLLDDLACFPILMSILCFPVRDEPPPPPPPGLSEGVQSSLNFSWKSYRVSKIDLIGGVACLVTFPFKSCVSQLSVDQISRNCVLYF